MRIRFTIRDLLWLTAGGGVGHGLVAGPSASFGNIAEMLVNASKMIASYNFGKRPIN